MLMNYLEIETARQTGEHSSDVQDPVIQDGGRSQLMRAGTRSELQQDRQPSRTHDAPDDVAGDMTGDVTSDASGPASLADRLLTALALMAVRSKRRQADLSAALRRSGLDASSQMLGTALRHLERCGFIENLVPLYDGGLLMSVTARGVETLNAHGRWPMLDDRDHATFYGKVA